MAYTVAKLAKLSGVSVRTLHWYDEVGLLKPAYYGANGYRYYEEEQLLILQQILFFRELGFDLKQVQQVLGKGDFDTMVALISHRKFLMKELERTQCLVETIDKTIAHIKGTKKMKEQEMYLGFSKEKQAAYEQEIIEQFGNAGRSHIEETRKNVKNWTKKEFDTSQEQFQKICKDLVFLMSKEHKPESKEVQVVIQRHYDWLKKFWTPTQESYAGHGQFIVNSDLRKAYEVHDKHLPEFIAQAIQIFANTKL